MSTPYHCPSPLSQHDSVILTLAGPAVNVAMMLLVLFRTSLLAQVIALTGAWRIPGNVALNLAMALVARLLALTGTWRVPDHVTTGKNGLTGDEYYAGHLLGLSPLVVFSWAFVFSLLIIVLCFRNVGKRDIVAALIAGESAGHLTWVFAGPLVLKMISG